MVVISLRELQRCEMITGVTLAIISTLGYRCHRDAIYSTLITGDVHHFSEGEWVCGRSFKIDRLMRNIIKTVL